MNKNVIIYYEKDCEVYGREVTVECPDSKQEVIKHTPTCGRYISHICIEGK